MTRVLVYSEAWGGGGIETFVTNVIRRLQGNGLSFDIFSTWDWSEKDDVELAEMGVNRICVFRGYKPNQIKRLISGVKGFSSQLMDKKYDVVWINTMNGLGFLYAWKAKEAGVPIRIVHSHNVDVGDKMKALKRMVGKLGSLLLGDSATVNVACSPEAGDYLFLDRPFSVVNNGIDINQFSFSQTARDVIRKKLGVNEGEALIGNIGRISFQKNPLFQVDIFAEYKKMNPSSRYLMVGKGDLAEEVLSHVKELGIPPQDVLIQAPVANPHPYYCALDAFLMPSLFEGMPIAKIEAQCCGVPVLSSDSISSMSNVTELAETCSLEDSAYEWAKRLDKLLQKNKGAKRDSYPEEISRAGFSIDKSTAYMRNLFLYGALND